MKVAFIGLGIMGSRMAAHLLNSNIDLMVWNRSTAPMHELETKGAKSSHSVSHAVLDADIVFSMLSTPEVVKDIFFGESGVLSIMKENAIWIDCSTVNPSFSILSNKESQKFGVRFIDAPVTGSKQQAQNAELVFFVGSSSELLKEVEPLLKLMGNKILQIGETGKGTSFKMLVNLMLGQSMLIFTEATLLGKRLDISEEFLFDVMPNLPVIAPFLKSKIEMIKEDNFVAQFPLELMLKDLHLACITAYEKKQPLYLANLAKELFSNANTSEIGRLDFSVIYKSLVARTK